LTQMPLTHTPMLQASFILEQSADTEHAPGRPASLPPPLPMFDAEEDSPPPPRPSTVTCFAPRAFSPIRPSANAPQRVRSRMVVPRKKGMRMGSRADLRAISEHEAA